MQKIIRRAVILNLVGVFAFVCILALALGGRGVNATPPEPYDPNNPPPPLKFLVLGDSIATGYASWANAVNGVPERLANPYAKQIADEYEFDYVNLAHEGDTTQDLLNLVTNNAYMRGQIMSADIVHISIGGNDVLNGDYNLFMDIILNWHGKYIAPIPIIAPNLPTMGNKGNAYAKGQLRDFCTGVEQGINQIIQTVKALNPTANIVAFNQYKPPFAQGYGTAIPQQIENAIIAEIGSSMWAMVKTFTDLEDIITGNGLDPILAYTAEYFNTLVVARPEFFDIYSVMNNVSLFNSDDYIHPNAVGHNAIYSALSPVIGEFIPEPTPIDPPPDPQDPCLCDGDENQCDCQDCDCEDCGEIDGGEPPDPNDPDPIITHLVRVTSAGGGTASNIGNHTIEDGDLFTIEPIPATGWRFLTYVINGVPQPNPEPIFTFYVTQNMMIIIYFETDPNYINPPTDPCECDGDQDQCDCPDCDCPECDDNDGEKEPTDGGDDDKTPPPNPPQKTWSFGDIMGVSGDIWFFVMGLVVVAGGGYIAFIVVRNRIKNRG